MVTIQTLQTLRLFRVHTDIPYLMGRLVNAAKRLMWTYYMKYLSNYKINTNKN